MKRDIDLDLYMNLQFSAIYLQRELAKCCAECTLTYTQYAVLDCLYRKGRLSICEILEGTLATSGNLTVVLRNLEKARLIKRETNNEDKRSYLISLTQAGKERVALVRPRQSEILSGLLHKLSSEEKEKMVDILERLNSEAEAEECFEK